MRSLPCKAAPLARSGSSGLLRQPGGFEGIGSTPELLTPPNTPVFHSNQAKPHLLNPGFSVAALQTTPSGSLHSEDLIRPEILYFVRLDLELGKAHGRH